MIQGSVDANLLARIRLRIRGPNGVEFDVDTVVDTGFDDSLILPSASISILGLKMSSTGQAILADGSVKHFDVYAADAEWDGVWRPVQVSAVGDEALMGMAMLVNTVVRIEVVPGGTVEIARLP